MAVRDVGLPDRVPAEDHADETRRVAVAAVIIGHDEPTMTYVLYSDGTLLAVKQEAIEAVAIQPRHKPLDVTRSTL